MADSKISELPLGGALAGTEPLPIVQDSATKQVSVQDVANLSTLETTLVAGNETLGTNIKVNDADAIELENTSTLKKGTYDFGASGGISRICGVGYEDMWQAGIHHVFDNNGLIRESNNCFDIVPDGSFDNTLRFKVGSRWILDDGTVYVCSDASTGTAAWAIGGFNLQSVTDVGADTTKRISIGNFPNDYVQYREDGLIKLDTTNQTKLNFITPTGNGQINIPDVVNATETFALLSDLPAGGGDVVGPASSVNNNIATFNGTDGKLIQDGGTTIADINTNAVDRVTVKLSQSINKGQAVYISGANGTNILVSKADNTSEATSSKTIGLLETSGATNAIVNVVTSGLLDGLNTSAATIGDPVWLGTSGNLIYGLASKPFAPAHLVYIGVVSRVSATVGEILVKVQNGFELKEIHDVSAQTPNDKDVLQYESATSLWKNKALTTASVAASTDRNYVSDAKLIVVNNTSGTNTGDQDLSSLVVKNTAITGATKTKITYDSKGLVTSGADATTADIADSTNKRYVTDAQATVIGNTSGTNTGDETTATIKTKLGITTLSGSNTGDQDLSTLMVKANNLSDLTNTTTARTNLGLDNKSAVLAETATDGTASSGTANTYSTGVLITPSMIDANTSIMVKTRVRKTGVAGTVTVRIYANTTNDIAGSPILIGFFTSGATTLNSLIQRDLAIKVKAGTGTGTEVQATTISGNTEYGALTSAVSNLAIDWTSNKYIVVAVQNTVGADSSLISFLKVSR